MAVNTKKCADCGEEQADIKFKDRFYCRGCAGFLMAKLKLQYYAGMKTLGWEIQELWEQLRDPTDLWLGDAESFLEADEIRSPKMKIMVLPRIFFEKIKGAAEEDRLLESYRIISINSGVYLPNGGRTESPLFIGQRRRALGIRFQSAEGSSSVSQLAI